MISVEPRGEEAYRSLPSKRTTTPYGNHVGNPREPLNKSPLARPRLCGMGCAKGDDANATATGGAVSSEGRCDPAAGCIAQSSISAVVASPTRVDPASRVPRPALRVATAKGGAVSSEGRCDPEAECRRPQQCGRGRGIPAVARSLLCRAPRAALWGAPPFA